MKTAEAAQSSGHYYAYLVRGIDEELLERAMTLPDPKRWWNPPAEAILIGTIQLSGWDSNTATATAKITIPQLDPGQYQLMFCDLGCATPLADVVPSAIAISADPLAARMARQLQRTNYRLQRTAARLRADLRRAMSSCTSRNPVESAPPDN